MKKATFIAILIALCIGVTLTASAQSYLYWDVVGIVSAVTCFVEVGSGIDVLNISFAGGSADMFCP